MASATRAADAAVLLAVDAVSEPDFADGNKLLEAERAIAATPALRSRFTDFETSAEDKTRICRDIFSRQLPSNALHVLVIAVSERWSSSGDFLAAIEDAGIRLIVRSAPEVPVDQQLYAFLRLVRESPQLELALASKLGDPAHKAKLLASLFRDAHSPEVEAIVSHLVARPRGRRLGAMLDHAAAVVANARGYRVAKVTSAIPLDMDQRSRLAAVISADGGAPYHIENDIDPAVLGGVRVQLADDVIDGTFASQLNDLRQKIAS